VHRSRWEGRDLDDWVSIITGKDLTEKVTLEQSIHKRKKESSKYMGKSTQLEKQVSKN
jgi:hypothetical protein